MQNKLTQNFNIKYSEMNENLALKPYSLLNFLQDIASESAENLGFGYSYISQKNLAWFLIKYRIEFNEYPKGVYDLKISTSPRGYNRLFAYRDFEIFNDEKVFARAFSMWSMVDLNTRSTVLVGDSIDNPYMTPYQKQKNDLSFSKIKPLVNIDNQKEFLIRYNDLDVNGHANNGNYITWALETLNFEFLSTKKIKTLDVMFKKEAKYDTKILSQVQIIDNTTTHVIKNKETDEELCLAQINWE